MDGGEVRERGGGGSVRGRAYQRGYGVFEEQKRGEREEGGLYAGCVAGGKCEFAFPSLFPFPFHPFLPSPGECGLTLTLSQGSNLSEGHWDFNGIPRDGGKFLWAQIHNARRLGVRVMYGAMWDEYDEGTAFMPVVQTKRQVPLPVGEGGKYRFMALDEDGYDLPGDW